MNYSWYDPAKNAFFLDKLQRELFRDPIEMTIQTRMDVERRATVE